MVQREVVMKKIATKKPEKPAKVDSMSKLMSEVEQSNPSFVRWLRSKDGKRK